MSNGKLPAFPVGYDYDRDQATAWGGLTQREWYAGVALPGILASYANPSALELPTPEQAAREATEYADALIRKLAESLDEGGDDG